MADHPTPSAEDLYAALTHTRQLSSHRLVAYRCSLPRKRCLLLDVIETPAGRLLHFPRYKLPPGVNEATSSEAGRAANTEDGGHKWKGGTGFESAVADSFEVHCDHVRAVVLTKAGIVADVGAGRREVTVHPHR
ncbi:hypothetical protein BH24ACT3_BH24ACT3_11510 [soil metagenome]